MSERKSGRDKKGRSVVAGCVVICIAAAIIGSLAIAGSAAEQTSDTVVTVNAPEMVKAGEAFEASIDVDNITAFNSGQFDLSFDASVVNVTDVVDGSLDGETIPVDRWSFVDSDTIRVIFDVSGIAGVNGSGNLATISFEVVGMGGDRSMLDIFDVMLVNTEAEAIPAVWVNDEIIVGPVKVEVNAPEMAKAGETFVASIDVDSIADFNTGLFDLSFDSSVVNVTEVANGSLDGETIPVDKWERMDNDTIRVFLDVSGIAGVNGSGNLATISFEVVGMGGDRSVLDISNGTLVNTEAEEIPAEWVDDEVIVGPVTVEVNAPEFVEVGGTFTATIDVVDDVANINMALFDLSFDSSVVNVTEVANGSLDGETIPVDKWECMDNDTIRVFLEVSGIAGVNGSGSLATISFEVVGMGGDRSVLDISDGMLVNNEAEEIPTEWIDDMVIVGPVTVEVNAPEMAKSEETFVASIDVDSIADFNAGLFDLSFDSSVVNVTDVADGSLDGETISIDMWARMDNDTIRVFLNVSGIAGVSGAGNLAEISFEVVGLGGDRSVLDVSGGMLANAEVEEIPAMWIDDKVIVGPVEVEVNAPEMAKAGETFVASVDVDSIANFTAGLFDLSFDSSVVNVTEVADGSLDGATISVDMWDYMAKDAIRVFLNVSGITGVSGTGNLAEISFEVVGKRGDTSMLDISNVMLANNKAEKIPTEWIDDLFTVSPVMVTVNAPAKVNAGETFDATIDVDDIADFNSGQFDLSFNASVVNVAGVAGGSLDGATIPVSKWEHMDNDTIRVILEVSGIAGVSGSGNLATINFRVVGESGDKSALDISNGMLVDMDAEEIPAVWIPTEVTLGE